MGFYQQKHLKGTQKFQSYSSVNETRVLVKSYSSLEMITVDDIEYGVDIKDTVGFVTCKYWDTWWLGCVLGVEGDEVNLKIGFLEPHGPSPSFKYLQFLDILVVHKGVILTKVDPTTSTIYWLTESETQTTTKELLLKSTKKK